MSRTIAFLLMVAATPHLAGAQPSTKPCYVYVGEALCTEVQPLWIGMGTHAEGPLTFRRLAEVAAPILWPSPREFLLLEGQTLDVPGRINHRGGGRTVYYHVREVRLKPPQGGAAVLSSREPRITNPHSVWSDSPGDLPVDELDRVFITYFFYYPEDRGVGGHMHDVEAMDVQIRIRRVCQVSPSLAALTPAECSPNATVWPAAQLESASGSAHGVGWYTNTLRVSSTHDTVLPLTVLVEENKHATSPDRDGDGTYMPHYDVNRNTNDAWGIRDVAGTGKLGGASFRAESSRARRPGNQVNPPSPSPRLVEHYTDALGKSDALRESALQAPDALRKAEECGTVSQPYCLVEAFSDPICKQSAALEASLMKTDNRLQFLLDDKDFCAPPSATTVKGPRGSFERALLDAVRFLSPGPDGEYGFQNAVQRLSFAYRFDGGHGASAIFPIGHEMPFFGGWVVIKANVIAEHFQSFLPPLERTSVEAMYSPSASRSFDWYVTVGRESHRATKDDPRTWHVAEEIGVRIRFSSERLRVVRFLGGRMGLRAESLTAPRNVRFVYEFGAGSW